MASAKALIIGIIKSTQFSSLSVSHLLSKTPACTLVSFRILLILCQRNLLHLLPLDSRSMTLFTSLKTLLFKLSSAVFWVNNAKWISWEWLNGSWVFILHGVSHPTLFWIISINQVLLPIWSKASFKIPGMLLLLPHLTVLVYQLTPLPPPQMTTILRLNFDVRPHTKVSLVVLVGCQALSALIFLLFTPSLLLIAINLQCDT
jgi:hypothetical protein